MKHYNSLPYAYVSPSFQRLQASAEVDKDTVASDEQVHLTVYFNLEAATSFVSTDSDKVTIEKIDEHNYILTFHDVEDQEVFIIDVKVVDPLTTQSVDLSLQIIGQSTQPRFTTNILDYWAEIQHSDYGGYGYAF